MLNYAVVNINGRQYKVTPDQAFEIDYVKDAKNFTCEQVMLVSEGDKLTIGTPFLKESLNFEVLDQVRGPKIRVAKYHAKANTRRVVGFRARKTQVKLVVKGENKK